eukprot:g15620.t1
MGDRSLVEGDESADPGSRGIGNLRGDEKGDRMAGSVATGASPAAASSQREPITSSRSTFDSSFLELQRSFLVCYGDAIESVIQNGIFLLPVSASGVREQFLYSLAELFGVYKLLITRSDRLPNTVAKELDLPEDVGGVQVRDLPLHLQTKKNKKATYLCFLFLLKAVRSLQLAIEMQVPGWKTCLLLELVKIAAKAVLLKLLRGSGCYFEKWVSSSATLYTAWAGEGASGAVSGSSAELGTAASAGLATPASGHDASKPAAKLLRTANFVGKRSGFRFSAPAARPRDLSRRCLFGEVLYHLRPVLVLLLEWRNQKSLSGRSWPAWVVALVADLFAVQLQWSCRKNDILEKEKAAELRRRRAACLYAVLRSPFFEAYFPAEYLERLWDKIPLLRSLNLVQLLLLWRPYYFYTSGT